MKDRVFLKAPYWIIRDEITGPIGCLKIRVLLSFASPARKTYCFYLWLQLYSINISFHPDKLPGLKRSWKSDPFTLPFDTHWTISHCLALQDLWWTSADTRLSGFYFKFWWNCKYIDDTLTKRKAIILSWCLKTRDGKK